MFTPSILILLASAGLIEARSVLDARHHHGLHMRANNDDASATTLAANAIQTGSFVDGSEQIGANEANQAKSQISTNNFINFCAGKTLSNGLQITTGSCNGIPMGDLPAKTAMVSSVITFPLPGSASIESDTTFNITVQMSNLVAGSFTNADATYFSAPQFLSGGQVVGHTHVTVQDMGASLNPKIALDPTQFAFFKGINDAGNGKGLLSATVTGGLPAGNYRVCTMASASNHQPVIMPVAQRGTADDCTKFTVIGNGKVANAASNDGSGGQAAAALAASAVAAGPGAIESSASVDSSSSLSVAEGNGKDTSTSETSTTTKAGKGSKGSKDTTTTSAELSTTSISTSALSTSASTTTKAGKGGKGNDVTTASKATQTTIVQKVVVIETFFEFILSLGGLPPSVGKQGESFVVLEEVFEDIVSAAGAACTAQFNTCVGFSGPGFSFEECSSQKESCGSAASTQTSASTAAKVTATATVPPTATVTGSVISEATITTSVASTSQAVAAVTDVAHAQTTAAAVLDTSSSSSTCSLTTSTTWVDPPSSTPAVASSSSTTSSASSTSTAKAVSGASASALGGIAAPAVSDSGDSTRPFEVNGNTFVNKSAAVQRACDIQFNACANAFNSGAAAGAFDISDCQDQENDCISNGGS
ncbi:hypothetical protein EG329_011318 [Mollisiaceae sp. DMI_Dod_QoI]|nr:hypothetical protein EG329_011318 [Helotiales sp. DMI_Dod_QoI]